MSKLNKYKLSEIAYIKMGQSPDGESCNEDGIGIPLLNGPSEFTDFYPIPKQFTINAKRFSEEGEILFCVRGSTTGRMNWSNGTYAIGRGLASITHKEGKQLNHFLKYLIHSNLDSILKAANGSTFPNLTSDIFSSFELSVPDLLTQQKIASVLSSLDAKIELNNRINTELEAMAKTLYDYWFVQFDFPDAEDKPYKSSGGAMIWSEELKREIPKKWEVKTLLDIATYTNGLACQKYRPINNDYLRVIKIREMKDGFSESSEFVRSDIPEKVIIENGDILFSWSASLEVIIWAKGRGALNQHIFKVTSKKYPKSFYYFQLANYLQHFKMLAENRKTTMGHITQEHLQQSRIAVPSNNDLIENLDRKISPILDKQIAIEQENQQLAHLRDWLLPMLMNGQVVVA